MIKALSGRLFIAGLALVAGLVLRSTATIHDELSDVQEVLVIEGPAAARAIRDSQPESEGSVARVPILGATATQDVRQQHAEIAYWLGDEAPPAGEDESANALFDDPLLAGDAAFRAVQRAQPERGAAIEGLDAVLQLYAEALEVDPLRRDAAFNYEFVARRRQALLEGGSLLDEPLDADADPADMHGSEGSPPDETAPGDFNVIVPMRPDERGEFEAGAGGVRQRQG